MRNIRAGLGFVLMFAVCAATQAATHVINRTVDANEVVLTGSAGMDWGAQSLTLAVGDELQLNYDFLPGQSLQIVNPTGLWAVISMDNDGDPHDAFFNHSLTFVGLSGPGQNVSPLPFSTGGWGIMAVFNDSQFLTTSLPAAISFTGLRFNIVVTGYSDGITERTYNSDFLVAIGDQMSVGTVPSIPEPSTTALLTLGLLGIALMVRRRHSKPALL